ncbi:MAG TPA: hypothetical protein VFL14_14675 [Xanthomonadales bacterium]|nr:hypothetical protein [Xanthomonadales bacterium]
MNRLALAALALSLAAAALPSRAGPVGPDHVRIVTATRIVQGEDCRLDFVLDGATGLSGRGTAYCSRRFSTPRDYTPVPSTGLVVMGVDGEGFIDCHVMRLDLLGGEAGGASLELACADDNVLPAARPR